ncbi:hypothetical protein AWB82_01656 [Caballeronia glebae]|uniref:C-deglycosylation enzyme beta subunit n=1 Tax=Caballeronia glebae TaxID=1777143 RepID=A0A158A3G2_9BURK|nr:DUF6379 domain-containing protein [Caballeronia glebae]SAK52338.1 hypothetical protein AWB82_01656 [Caballeronia glebae]
MFDKYIICENSLRQHVENGETRRYSVGVRLPYYRALGLSMVEQIALTIDGEPVAREHMTLTVADGRFPVAELGSALDARWGFGEIARLEVDGTLPQTGGAHDVQIEQHLRISYLPFTLVGKDRKQLAVV